MLNRFRRSTLYRFGSITRTFSPKQMSTMVNKAYLADHKAPLIMLSAKDFFAQLSDQEKLYAHYMSKASHAGSRIVLRQVSHESESIYDLIMAIHEKIKGRYPEGEQYELYKEYVAQFLSNLGNYKSFGDLKFIPRCTTDFFLDLLNQAGIEKSSKPSTASCLYSTWEEVVLKGIYYVDDKSALLGFPSEGHQSSYYFGDVSPEDMTLLKDEVFSKLKILPENTRIQKVNNNKFVILVASENTENDLSEYPKDPIKLSNGASAFFKFGDHTREMHNIVQNLQKARRYAANESQKKMFDQYIKHFQTGSSHAHKDSQKFWVKDLSPVIETNIGFIETYREPSGIIGEFESLVAIKNKKRTEKFATMVKSAGKFISLLPWDNAFEKPKFQPPDFTSLEVLTFAGSGIPAGINIPNYDDVRLNIGFKNVSLGNILSSSLGSKTPITFVTQEDRKILEKFQTDSFEVQVGIHELLGHGSGKLLSELEDGTFNFDREHPPLGLDGKPVTTYYKKGETWGSKFGQLAGAFEECRAEVIAMYLITNTELLDIFGFKTQEDQDNIIYAGFLQMARAGLLALEFWDPSTKKWGQPHMQARFSIMKTFLKHTSNEGFFQLSSTKSDFSDLQIKLDRSMIRTVGHAAIKDYLTHLHIYKSSGDVERGSKYFVERSTVDPDLAQFRPIVLEKKLPRRQFIQANTLLKDGQITLNEYDNTPDGILESFVQREV
ncbi:LANO_0G06062g1_1 [Lachancea nothofagi CBS 11611]|uniref:Dipeptidyl peptidase 3 n=1 Tax=Lachancea nothofagi CBS 11611 TaxID=1266666 RepID=A0A1G4KGV5_9SACH|nr:LANO_0G06062g1_1 [Lachancea nothofagi CBS 11611]